MRIRRTLSNSVAILALWFSTSTCSESEPTQVVTDAEVSLLQAHTPSHHTLPGAVVAQVPDPGTAGRHRQRRDEVRQFVALWKDADPMFHPVIERVKQKQRSLTAERSR